MQYSEIPALSLNSKESKAYHFLWCETISCSRMVRDLKQSQSTKMFQSTYHRQQINCEAQLATQLYKHFLRWPINTVN